ncbi:MAG: aminoacyl-tRNA hydrolase [Chlamydiota bacterium]|nr:aminoacyl-tRNA hydrolase [Chlamydiota bacterium]
MKVLVGLGNPGQRYHQTRHNAGFMALDCLAQNWNVSFTKDRKFECSIGRGQRDTNDFLLVKPDTFMNLSGVAVLKLIQYFHLSVQDVLIILDDVCLQFGDLRLRSDGSAGGHNGLASVLRECQSEIFPRLRIGIAPEENREEDLVSFVLGRFSEAELSKLEKTMDFVKEIAGQFVCDGFVASKKYMNDCKSRGESY